jgi:uncharacterized membrane protein
MRLVSEPLDRHGITGTKRRLVRGPVQLLSIGFEGSRFRGEILPELDRLKRARLIRIIDLLLVRKDDQARVAVMKASDLDWEEATEFGAFIGTLVGLTTGGLEGAERGAMIGAAELADGHVFDDQTEFDLANELPNGMSAVLVLIEHCWAVPLREAIARADGYELSNKWVTASDLLSAGLTPRDGGGFAPQPPL